MEILKRESMIPNVFHFCYGLVPNARFEFLDYLAIRSAGEVNRPDRIYLHHQYNCGGEWWDKARELVTLNQVEPPSEIHGRKLHHFAHRTDVLRLMVLKEYGGIYMDIDTLCIRPFAPLLGQSCVLAWQGTRGLCNAVILSEANGAFVNAWLESYRSFRSTGKDEYWDEHSVIMPARLAADESLCRHVTVLDRYAFFFPLSHQMHLLFESGDPGWFRHSYCVHYCESVIYEKWLSRITLDNALSGRTNFSRFARRALGVESFPTAGDFEITDSSPSRFGLPGSPGRSPGLWGVFTEALRFGLKEARDLLWLPKLCRNLGFTEALRYIPHWLRIKGARAREPFARLYSRLAAHPLWVRTNMRELAAFNTVFVKREYQCLDNLEDVSLIVDCGAHAGYACAYFLSRFTEAGVLAIEPDLDRFALLEKNLAPYGPRCRAMHAAVWSRSTQVTLEETILGPARKSRRQARPAGPDQPARLPALDLGTLLKENGLERISLLRMNIAGAEVKVFDPAGRTWMDHVDNLVVHVHGPECRAAVLGAVSSRDFKVSEFEKLIVCTRTAPTPSVLPIMSRDGTISS